MSVKELWTQEAELSYLQKWLWKGPLGDGGMSPDRELQGKNIVAWEWAGSSGWVSSWTATFNLGLFPHLHHHPAGPLLSGPDSSSSVTRRCFSEAVQLPVRSQNWVLVLAE